MKRMMKLNEIVVRECFANTIPKEGKMNECRDYWNEHHSDLGKVVYYRISLYDTDIVDQILKKNYTLCSGYQGNSKYNADYKEDAILN